MVTFMRVMFRLRGNVYWGLNFFCPFTREKLDKQKQINISLQRLNKRVIVKLISSFYLVYFSSDYTPQY